MILTDRRQAVAVWAVALVAVAVEAVRVHGTALYGIDFHPIYAGALHLRVNGDPYVAVPGVSPFVYPPSAALLFLPISYVGSHTADAGGLLLAAGSLVVLACGAAVLAGGSLFGRLAGVTLVVLALTPIGYATMQVGNLSLLTAAGFAWVLVLLGRDRWVAAGLLFGLLVAVKPLVAPAFVVFLLARRWGGAAAAVGVAVVLNLAALPLLDAPGDFVTKVLPSLARGDTLPERFNAALAGYGHHHGAPGWVVLAARVAVVGACVAVCWGAQRGPERWPIIATIATVGVALVSAQDEGHYSLVAVPVVVLLLVRAGDWVTRLLAAATAAVLAASNTVVCVLVGQLLVIVLAASWLRRTAATRAGSGRSVPSSR